jgi:hypothetical protein
MQTLRNIFTVQRVRLLAVGVGMLVIGVIIGVAFSSLANASAAHPYNTTNNASSTPVASQDDMTKYCKTYLSNIESQLKVSEQQIRDANKAALKATLDQAVKDGKITQSEEDLILQQVNSNSNGSICDDLASLTKQSLPEIMAKGGQYTQSLLATKQAIQKAVATKLQISVDELNKQINAGTSIVDIAKSKGVSQADLNATILGALKTQLDSAVKSGLITQDQADKIQQMFTKAIENGQYFIVGLDTSKFSAH